MGLIADITDALMKIAVYHEDPKTSLLPGGNTSFVLAVRTNSSPEEVKTALESVRRDDDDVVIHVFELTDRTEGETSTRDEPRYVLRIRTAGRPGILAAFTSVIARYDGDVVDFGTKIGGGRVSVLRVELPESADVLALNSDLYHLAEQVGVGIKFYDAARGEHETLVAG